jgi:Flp pilus assembly CpaF family ATPase
MSANVESQARRASALASALAPILPFLQDDSVVEIMLNADGSVWIDQLRLGMSCARMTPYEAETMLRFIASETNVELNAANPSLSAKLPFWGTRVQASIPPVVEAPVFAMRKPAGVVFSLDDYVRCGF